MDIKFFENPDKVVTLPSPKPPRQASSMRLQLETITPEIAQELINGNTDNRPCKNTHVKFLADQMRAGAWQVTGDPIKVSTSGRLLDGQHRLLAIIQSETTQQLYVARDCEEEIFSVLDTGRSRSSADVLATAGIQNYALLSAAAKLLILHSRGMLANMGNKQRAATNTEILDFVMAHDLAEAGRRAGAWRARCKLLNPGEWAALHYLFSQVDPVQATDFLQQITTGLNLTEGHPVLILRHRLQAARDGRFNFTASERLALTIKAWNALREGKKIAQLVWKWHDEFPVIV